MQVESKGNIASTSVGRPDYSAAVPTGVAKAQVTGKVYTSTDLAELAARLGSPNVYDRRGNVIFIDNFENGIGSYTYALGAGPGSKREWSSEVSRSGGFSLKLWGGVGTASSFTRSWATMDVGQNTGVEMGLACPAPPYTPLYLRIYITYNDSVLTHVAGAQFNNLIGSVSYLNDAGGWTETIRGLFLTWVPGTFSNLKLVVDLASDRYLRCMINQAEFDMSMLSSYKRALVSLPFASSKFEMESAPAVNSYCWGDDIIITQDEPENSGTLMPIGSLHP